MKKIEIVKVVSILLIIISMIGILSGCGGSGSGSGANTDEIKFRDIPFGTKFDKAMEMIRKDLAGQNYQGSGTIIFDDTIITAEYKNIKLYDYYADMMLYFTKEATDDESKAKFMEGTYTVSIYSDVSRYNFVKFCEDNIVEKYGDYTVSDSGVKIWKVGETSCSIEEDIMNIKIDYWSTTLLEKAREYANKKEEQRRKAQEEIEANQNKGL